MGFKLQNKLGGLKLGPDCGNTRLSGLIVPCADLENETTEQYQNMHAVQVQQLKEYHREHQNKKSNLVFIPSVIEGHVKNRHFVYSRGPYIRNSEGFESRSGVSSKLVNDDEFDLMNELLGNLSYPKL